MIVVFKKLLCSVCLKIRNHEVIEIPCCVVCGEYNQGETIQPEPLELERFIH